MADAAAERRRRALEEPLDFTVRETSPLFTVRVRNPLHGTQYDAYVPEYPTASSAMCTCPDFARRAMGTCKHLEGLFRWLASHPAPEPKPRAQEPSTAALWEEIDRRRARRPVSPTLVGMREVGELLCGGP